MTPKLKLHILDNFPGPLTNKSSHSQGSNRTQFLFGVIVRKQYICNVLGVSRSPVSEATAQLEKEKMKSHLNQLILISTPLENEHPHLFENS